MRTLEFTVTFKENPQEPQQTRQFKIPEAAYAFAITIENDGGIAVVTQGYKQDIVPPNRPYPNFTPLED